MLVVCILIEFLQLFNIWHTKTCKMHVDWQTQCRFWHVVWFVKKINTCQLTLYKLKWHATGCMTLRWYLRRNVDVDQNSFLFLKMSRDTLKLNVKWNLSNTHIGCRYVMASLMAPKLVTPWTHALLFHGEQFNVVKGRWLGGVCRCCFWEGCWF